MTVPTPRTWVASEFVTATIMNGDVRDSLNFLLAPPRAYAYRSTNQSFTAASWDVLAMAAELYDPYATPVHDTATNNTRMVAPEAGIYQVIGHLTWDVSATGTRFLSLRKNAAGSFGSGTELNQITVGGVSGVSTRMMAVVDVSLNAGDYVELFGQQNSGGTLAVIGGQADAFLSIRWVAKQ